MQVLMGNKNQKIMHRLLQGNEPGLAMIPASRKRKANDIFASMVEEDTSSVRTKMSNALKTSKAPVKSASKKKKAKKLKSARCHYLYIIIF